MDYAFMTAEEAEDSIQPTLVIYDDDKKAVDIGCQVEGCH